MKIQCTVKMFDELKIEPNLETADTSALYSWHCHVLKFDRKKTVLLVNDLTRISVVLYGLTAKEFKNFGVLAKESIKQVLLMEQVSEEIVKRYLLECSEVEYTKSGSRSLVAKMKGIARDLEYYSYEMLNPNTGILFFIAPTNYVENYCRIAIQ